mmetsp:Transcript_9244/g.33902  ORF Transcript_9244/g.33902 Transcript_9244/m.33902 type:complete len:270 (+) Transcript_9244:62-871(+)
MVRRGSVAPERAAAWAKLLRLSASLVVLLAVACLAYRYNAQVKTESASTNTVHEPNAQRKAAVDKWMTSSPRTSGESTVGNANFYQCRPEPHTGYGGETFTWGLDFKVKDEGECCAACLAHARTCGTGNEGTTFWHASKQAGPTKCGRQHVACNTWTYCPLERCFSYDIHNHTQHECWLKFNADPAKPFVSSRGNYPLALRQANREHWPYPVAESTWPWEMPESVSWTSGIINLEPSVQVDHGEAFSMAGWYPHFCSKHGPCEEGIRKR